MAVSPTARLVGRLSQIGSSRSLSLVVWRTRCLIAFCLLIFWEAVYLTNIQKLKTYDCHYDDTPCLSLLKHLIKLQGGAIK